MAELPFEARYSRLFGQEERSSAGGMPAPPAPCSWAPCTGLAEGKARRDGLSVLLLCGLFICPGVWHNNFSKLELFHFLVGSRSRNFPQIELEN